MRKFRKEIDKNQRKPLISPLSEAPLLSYDSFSFLTSSQSFRNQLFLIEIFKVNNVDGEVIGEFRQVFLHETEIVLVFLYFCLLFVGFLENIVERERLSFL